MEKEEKVSDLEVRSIGDLEVVRKSMFPTKAEEARAVAKGYTPDSPTDQQPPPPVYLARQETYASSYRDPKAEMVAPPYREERTVLGLSRTVFIALAIGLVVFIIGMIATVVCVVISKRAHEFDSDVAATAAEAFANSTTSKIAATNWTDSSGISRVAVFYQDDSNAIMTQLYDSVSNVWTEINVTASIMNTSSTAGLDVKRGTPLAAATNTFQVSLYYLTSTNHVAEVWMPGSQLGQWFLGALGSALDAQAAPNSRLTAYWQLCTTCPGSLLLMYEDVNGVIQAANMTGALGLWNMSSTIPTSVSAAGSGLALSPFVDGRSIKATGTDPNALRVYHFIGGSLCEMMYGPLGFFSWIKGNFGSAISTNAPSPPPEIASLTYEVTGAWDHNLVTYLTTNGTMQSHAWDGSGWTVKTPTLSGDSTGSTNFSTFAVTQGLKMYGIANGAIHEYQVSPKADPFAWRYVGVVKKGGIM